MQSTRPQIQALRDVLAKRFSETLLRAYPGCCEPHSTLDGRSEANCARLRGTLNQLCSIEAFPKSKVCTTTMRIGQREASNWERKSPAMSGAEGLPRTVRNALGASKTRVVLPA
jgi:hypothetical protein